MVALINLNGTWVWIGRKDPGLKTNLFCTCHGCLELYQARLAP